MSQTEADKNAAHNAAMKDLQSERRKMMAEKKKIKKGLVIVHTGDGKGKSSSAFGMIMRAIAHGMPCGVVQFIKGTWNTGEKQLLRERFAEECKFVVSGEGFTWDTQDREADIRCARMGWDAAKEMIRDPGMRLVVLDEINIALRYDYLPIAEIVAFLSAEKPEMTHVVLTGRDAKPELIEIADLVTEMREIKHPFREQGVVAQRGVEY